jgi:formate hydrogenlyase transcriptional activator
VDVRVMAATNRDLGEAVRSGRFRADLYYRLNVFPIEVPPLRDRRSDIPQLVMFFLADLSKKLGKRVDAVSPRTLDRLTQYPWPGNVRELRNVLERAVVLAAGPAIELERELLDVPPASAGPDRPEGAAPPAASIRQEASARAGFLTPPPLVTLEEVERGHILAALEAAGWVIEGARGAARTLALHPNTLRSRMDKLGIKRPRRDA